MNTTIGHKVIFLRKISKKILKILMGLLSQVLIFDSIFFTQFSVSHSILELPICSA
jgi:hypothetical protein